MPKITSIIANQNDNFVCIARPGRSIQPYADVSGASMRRLTDHLNRNPEFRILLTSGGFYAHRPPGITEGGQL